jgi:hypothetical protein
VEPELDEAPVDPDDDPEDDAPDHAPEDEPDDVPAPELVPCEPPPPPSASPPVSPAVPEQAPSAKTAARDASVETPRDHRATMRPPWGDALPCSTKRASRRAGGIRAIRAADGENPSPTVADRHSAPGGIETPARDAGAVGVSVGSSACG